MANTSPAARPTAAPMKGSTGSTSASAQRGAQARPAPVHVPGPNDTPVKKLACSLNACSHSSKDEGRWPKGAPWKSLGLVMVAQI